MAERNPTKGPHHAPAAGKPTARQRPEERPFLARVTSVIGAAVSPASAVKGFLEETARYLDVRAWMAAWDPERGSAEWLPEGAPGPFPARLADVEGGLLRRALVEGIQVTIGSAVEAGPCPERRYLGGRGTGGWAFFPMTAAGQTVGCLVISGEGAGRLEEEDLRALRGALPVIALVLRTAGLQRELEARVDERTAEIALLYDVSRSLGFVVTPQDLFALLGKSLHAALSFDASAFVQILPDRQDIVVQAATAVGEKSLRTFKGLVVAEARKLAGTKPSRIPARNARVGPSRGRTSSKGAEIQSVAHVPLIVRGTAIGLMSVASHEPEAFREAQMRLLYTIANQASLTLDRLRATHEAEATKIHSMLESMAEG
ncbi:MAG TPA: GAF domain-containing protein, partial [Candidatus Polarisedimenticolia bacterium]|nr:GAF domain-containing protein [Candidatus Polarisedimenticolia bacterium]